MSSRIHSMTGFAALSGSHGALSWDWDIRSVNARGLDMRLRLAEGFEALELPLRRALSAALTRGSVSVNLKLARQTTETSTALSAAGLQNALNLVEAASRQAEKRGVVLSNPSVADVLQMRGVVETGGFSDVPAEAVKAAAAQIPVLLVALGAMRANEGAALDNVLEGQLAKLAELTTAALNCAQARAASAGLLLHERVAALLASAKQADTELDAARLAQELALLAVKTDITEEIDRLITHIKAAQDLLAGGGAVGRRLDFLMQEFNREANTLCSKAQSSDLTRIGLELKVVIDQMREQAQNLE
ncbi:MAG: YicC/YloC family endoribonuclease [Paracoccaceae bacterium]